MRLYVIPLLSQELQRAEENIKLYKKKIDECGFVRSESKIYFEEKRDYNQAVKQEIIEAINKLEL